MGNIMIILLGLVFDLVSAQSLAETLLGMQSSQTSTLTSVFLEPMTRNDLLELGLKRGSTELPPTFIGNNNNGLINALNQGNANPSSQLLFASATTANVNNSAQNSLFSSLTGTATSST